MHEGSDVCKDRKNQGIITKPLQHLQQQAFCLSKLRNGNPQCTFQTILSQDLPGLFADATLTPLLTEGAWLWDPLYRWGSFLCTLEKFSLAC